MLVRREIAPQRPQPRLRQRPADHAAAARRPRPLPAAHPRPARRAGARSSPTSSAPCSTAAAARRPRRSSPGWPPPSTQHARLAERLERLSGDDRVRRERHRPAALPGRPRSTPPGCAPARRRSCGPSATCCATPRRSPARSAPPSPCSSRRRARRWSGSARARALLAEVEAWEPPGRGLERPSWRRCASASPRLATLAAATGSTAWRPIRPGSTPSRSGWPSSSASAASTAATRRPCSPGAPRSRPSWPSWKGTPRTATSWRRRSPPPSQEYRRGGRWRSPRPARRWGKALVERIEGELKDLGLGRARLARGPGAAPPGRTARWCSTASRSTSAATGSIRSSSSSPRTRARSRGRSPASPRAASCRASISPSSSPRAARRRRPGRRLVFDEVDTGIGGAEAAALGRKLQRLAKGGQILAVTHLPQVASYADLHFKVEQAGGRRPHQRAGRGAGRPRTGSKRWPACSPARRSPTLSLSHARELIAGAARHRKRAGTDEHPAPLWHSGEPVEPLRELLRPRRRAGHPHRVELRPGGRSREPDRGRDDLSHQGARGGQGAAGGGGRTGSSSPVWGSIPTCI